MDSFCVLHITKYKGDLGSIGAHLDRLHIPTNANEQKVGFNEELYLGEGQELNVRLQDILGIDLLIKKGVDLNVKSNFKNTPPHESAQHGKLEVVKLLLVKGADIHAKNIENATPFDLASRKGHHEVANLFI